MRYNDLRHLTASIFKLKDVAHDTSTEPPLQSLTGETLRLHTAISADSARLDVAASSIIMALWAGCFEKTFLDIRVFNPYARSNHQQTLPTTY